MISIITYIQLLNNFNIHRFVLLIYGVCNQNPNPECSYRYQCPIFSQISNVTQALRVCNYNLNRAEKPQQPASLILLKNESSLVLNTGEFFLLASECCDYDPNSAFIWTQQCHSFFVHMSPWQNLTSSTLICPDLSHTSAN